MRRELMLQALLYLATATLVLIAIPIIRSIT